MVRAIGDYLNRLAEGVGSGWNRFWYTPRDPYGLGVLRIATGLLALYFQTTFGPDLVRLFGPDGMLPVDAVRQWSGDQPVLFSYLSTLRTPGELWAAHILGTLLLVLFTIGLFTRLTSVLALVVTLAYVHRAPMLTGQFETILTMLLFYLCLGPAGRALSVDARIARRKADRDLTRRVGDSPGADRSVAANVSTRLIQVHLCVVCLMMGVSQIAEPGETWWLGDALWWLIAKPESRLVDLTLIHRHAYVLNALSHAVVLFEVSFPILVWNRLTRPLMLTVAWSVWGFLLLITGLVPFFISLMVASLAFAWEGKPPSRDETFQVEPGPRIGDVVAR